MKRLIVNADDLGYDPEIDRGILEAHTHGLVTSATAMVETPFAADALRAAPGTLGVGLHVVVDPRADRAEAEAALLRQLARFEALRGAPPTHLDSHKHAHASGAVLDAFVAVAAARGLPVRAIDDRMRAELRARGVATPDRFLGDAALRPAWTAERLIAVLATIGEGVTEIMSHPGHAPSHARTSFGVEREEELRALCDARARAVVQRVRIRLCGYADAWAHARGAPPRG
ncbi:carbohydrate deacetylase [Anaeromyxobacter oryzae]|uniref:Carbohydrate deacetylase n=1 Tax=Anaeromyxobacter oryzae TaxID=2918170 RepID=A0ABN6N3P8_9BACT|nr:ChbG/HpnK family deacetylase [Anaeromyxobacter oryzae]BDG06478.1 carbohydrate deacetylase [Anaeromyxobacter oryzae]